ncbi:MAG: PA2779 family protein [Gammaproteobacteria bacterium]|nr:PA2779 family protein [Gammaproteobacteria bacterium]
MMLVRSFKKLTVMSAIVLASLFIGLPAQAGMLGTAEMLNMNSQSSDISSQRAWIQQQLEVNGVDMEDAALRVASLSDQQVEQVHQRFEEMPAGAGALGAVVFIAVVLMVTDLVGYTDVYPFIRPASNTN